MQLRVIAFHDVRSVARIPPCIHQDKPAAARYELMDLQVFCSIARQTKVRNGANILSRTYEQFLCAVVARVWWPKKSLLEGGYETTR